MWRGKWDQYHIGLTLTQDGHERFQNQDLSFLIIPRLQKMRERMAGGPGCGGAFELNPLFFHSTFVALSR